MYVHFVKCISMTDICVNIVFLKHSSEGIDAVCAEWKSGAMASLFRIFICRYSLLLESSLEMVNLSSYDWE